jgi:hypothetical protein
MVFPVLLGSGKRLFSDADSDAPTRLTVVSDERVGDVELLVLRPVS